MAFEKWVPKQAEKIQEPQALIRPTGLISFDAASVEAFGLDKASHAVLHFDKTKKAIGVAFTDNPEEKGAVKVSRRRRTVGVKAPQFFEDYRIILDEPKRCPVRKDPKTGLVVVDAREFRRRRGSRSAS